LIKKVYLVGTKIQTY